MEERMEMKQWIIELESEMSASHEYWDKLTDSLKRRDKLCLRILQAVEREQYQEKEAGEELKKSLGSLSESLGEIEKAVSAGFGNQETMWRQLEEQGRDREQELSKCRNSIAFLEREKCRLEEEKQNLEGEKKGLQEENNSLEEKKKSLEKEKNEIETERQKLYEKNKELGSQIEKMERHQQESGDLEVDQTFSLYKRYKAWNGAGKDQFGRLTDTDFWEFVNSCSEDERIAYIFNGLKDMVWREEDQVGISIMNDIIDFCIKRQNARGRLLQRQNVERNDTYSGSSHQKSGGSQSCGYIKRVLMQGVRDENGVVLEGCKAFVEVE